VILYLLDEDIVVLIEERLFLKGSSMSSSGVQLSDGRVQHRVENYTKFWNKDLSQETDTDNDKRLNNYTDLVNGQFSRLWLYGV